MNFEPELPGMVNNVAANAGNFASSANNVARSVSAVTDRMSAMDMYNNNPSVIIAFVVVIIILLLVIVYLVTKKPRVQMDDPRMMDDPRLRQMPQYEGGSSPPQNEPVAPPPQTRKQDLTDHIHTSNAELDAIERELASEKTGFDLIPNASEKTPIV